MDDLFPCGAAGGLLGGNIHHVSVSVFGEVGEGHGVSLCMGSLGVMRLKIVLIVH